MTGALDVDFKDAETAWVMGLARQIGVTIHVRGTHGHPVVEFKDRRTRQVVGGIELKKRMARLCN